MSAPTWPPEGGASVQILTPSGHLWQAAVYRVESGTIVRWAPVYFLAVDNAEARAAAMELGVPDEAVVVVDRLGAVSGHQMPAERVVLCRGFLTMEGATRVFDEVRIGVTPEPQPWPEVGMGLAELVELGDAMFPMTIEEAIIGREAHTS